jgi:hypothetical protein
LPSRRRFGRDIGEDEEKKMRSWIALGVVAGAMVLAPAAFAGDDSTPAPADQTCAQHQTGNTVAGAAVGAVVGGVLGNNIAGRHHHGAGTALGAVTGGVAGGVIAHNATNCDPPAAIASDSGKSGDDSSAPPESDASAPPMDQPSSK